MPSEPDGIGPAVPDRLAVLDPGALLDGNLQQIAVQAEALRCRDPG